MAPNTEEGVQQVTLGRLVLRLRACAPKPRSRAKLYRTHQVPTRCERRRRPPPPPLLLPPPASNPCAVAIAPL